MKLRIRALGAHNLETLDTKHTCFLVDHILSIDAGSLMTTLDAEERNGLKSILLTHRHFDHIRDLPSLGLSTMDNGLTIDLYGMVETLDAVKSHLINGVVYPDFTKKPSPECPKFNLRSLTPGRMFSATGFDVKAVAVPHSAPAVGFLLRSPQGEVAAFTGDTGGGLAAFLGDSFKPAIFFVEMTYPNQLEERARSQGHLCPAVLLEELTMVQAKGIPIPSIVAVHMNGQYRDTIATELARIASALRVDITPAIDGAEFQV